MCSRSPPPPRILASAQSLARESDSLKGEVETFLVTVRAA
jgi:hypothetical protein